MHLHNSSQLCKHIGQQNCDQTISSSFSLPLFEPVGPSRHIQLHEEVFIVCVNRMGAMLKSLSGGGGGGKGGGVGSLFPSVGWVLL